MWGVESVFVHRSAPAGWRPSAVSELTLCFNQAGAVWTRGTRASDGSGFGLSGNKLETEAGVSRKERLKTCKRGAASKH